MSAWMTKQPGYGNAELPGTAQPLEQDKEEAQQMAHGLCDTRDAVRKFTRRT